jgi:APA family basic amino acid/polyamine antiporter
MVGTGVFTSLGFQVMGVKSIFALLMLWIIGGIMALCGALCYSELGAAMPRSGGEYTYLSKIYHPAVGFLSGWVSAIVGFAAPIALAAMALGMYVCTVFPNLNPTYIAASVVIGVTGIHSISVMVGSGFQNVFTTAKVILIIIFISLGFFMGEHQSINVLPSAGSWNEILSTSFAISLVFVSYAYSGWNASAYIASEIKNPQKNLPKSILTGTIIVLFLYVLLNFIFLYTVPISEMHDAKGGPIVEIGALSAAKIFGVTGGNIMSIIISILLVSTISSMIFAGPRVTMSIGEDMSALKVLGMKTKRGIPFIAILLQSTIALILIFTSSFGAVLTFLGFTLTLFTTLTVLGLFILRLKQPDLPRPFKTWGYPVTPAIFLLLNLWILWFVVNDKPKESLAGLATVVIGLIIYFISKHFSKNETSNLNQNITIDK